MSEWLPVFQVDEFKSIFQENEQEISKPLDNNEKNEKNAEKIAEAALSELQKQNSEAKDLTEE